MCYRMLSKAARRSVARFVALQRSLRRDAFAGFSLLAGIDVPVAPSQFVDFSERNPPLPGNKIVLAQRLSLGSNFAARDPDYQL
jgi:hypothetical protein